MNTVLINLDADFDTLAKQLEDLAKAVREKKFKSLNESTPHEDESEVSLILKKMKETGFFSNIKDRLDDVGQTHDMEVEIKGLAQVEIYGIDAYDLENDDDNNELESDLEVYDVKYEDDDAINHPDVKMFIKERSKKAKELMADVRKFATENEFKLGLVWQVILDN